MSSSTVTPYCWRCLVESDRRGMNVYTPQCRRRAVRRIGPKLLPLILGLRLENRGQYILCR